MDGILLIDKPTGMSSFGVVARVRGMIRSATGQKAKVGHCGTLDPLATGLMIIVVGKYTKRAGEFSKLDKTYQTELILGQTSTTADGEGEKTVVSARQPSKEEITQVLEQFVGKISQIPPAYSAIKVNGQRAYKLARAGKPVDIQPREVNIYSISNIDYDYPRLSFETEVSSGTYIRSLAEDIGQKLEVGAYMSALRRTKIAQFDLKDANTLDSLDPQLVVGLIDKQG